MTPSSLFPKIENFFDENSNFFYLSYNELSSILTFFSYEMNRGGSFHSPKGYFVL